MTARLRFGTVIAVDLVSGQANVNIDGAIVTATMSHAAYSLYAGAIAWIVQDGSVFTIAGWKAP